MDLFEDHNEKNYVAMQRPPRRVQSSSGDDSNGECFYHDCCALLRIIAWIIVAYMVLRIAIVFCLFVVPKLLARRRARAKSSKAPEAKEGEHRLLGGKNVLIFANSHGGVNAKKDKKGEDKQPLIQPDDQEELPEVHQAAKV